MDNANPVTVYDLVTGETGDWLREVLRGRNAQSDEIAV
jgi:hypothetical protein